jgi:hypothetical protein
MGAHCCAQERKVIDIEATTSDATMLTKKYDISQKVIGAGNFGKVFLANNIYDPV